MTGNGYKAKSRHRDSHPLWNNLSDATSESNFLYTEAHFGFEVTAKHLQFVKLFGYFDTTLRKKACKETWIIDFRSLFFSNIYIQCYKFSSKHYFHSI